MPYANNCRLIHFSIWWSHPSFKSSFSLPAWLLATIYTLPRFIKFAYLFWDCPRISLSNTPQNSLGDLTSWQFREICKAAVSRPKTTWSTGLRGNSYWSCPLKKVLGVLLRTISATLSTAFIPSVSLYSTSLELFLSPPVIEFSSLLLKEKFLSESIIILFKVLSCCSSKVNK